MYVALSLTPSLSASSGICPAPSCESFRTVSLADGQRSGGWLPTMRYEGTAFSFRESEVPCPTTLRRQVALNQGEACPEQHRGDGENAPGSSGSGTHREPGLRRGAGQSLREDGGCQLGDCDADRPNLRRAAP